MIVSKVDTCIVKAFLKDMLPGRDLGNRTHVIATAFVRHDQHAVVVLQVVAQNNYCINSAIIHYMLM